MQRDPPPQGLHQFTRRAGQPRTAQRRQDLRILLPINHRPENPPPAHPHHVGDHRVQLHVGLLQHPLNPLRVLHDLSCELLARARQISQLRDWLRRHKAASNQAVRQQIRNPARVVDVALAPGNVADMRRVGQRQLHPSLQHVPDRLPVHPGGFHSRMGALLFFQPVSQLHQLPRDRPKRSKLTPYLSTLLHAHAGHHCVLVHVQSRAAPSDYLHNALQGRPGREPRFTNSTNRAWASVRMPFRAPMGAQGSPVKLSNGLSGTKEGPTFIPGPATSNVHLFRPHGWAQRMATQSSLIIN